MKERIEGGAKGDSEGGEHVILTLQMMCTPVRNA